MNHIIIFIFKIIVTGTIGVCAQIHLGKENN